MIPMPISSEKYAEHFPPGPDYLIVKKLYNPYEKIGNIDIPQHLVESQGRFIAMGKVLAVSPLKSQDEYVEYMKEEIRKNPYVGFSFHVTADIAVLPWLQLPKDEIIVMLHVKDVAQFGLGLDGLRVEQQAYEEESLKSWEKTKLELRKELHGLE